MRPEEDAQGLARAAQFLKIESLIIAEIYVEFLDAGIGGASPFYGF